MSTIDDSVLPEERTILSEKEEERIRLDGYEVNFDKATNKFVIKNKYLLAHYGYSKKQQYYFSVSSNESSLNQKMLTEFEGISHVKIYPKKIELYKKNAEYHIGVNPSGNLYVSYSEIKSKVKEKLFKCLRDGM